MLGLRAASLQICNDRLTYQWRKRLNRDVIGFALAHVQPFVLPVDIVKCQIGNLTLRFEYRRLRETLRWTPSLDYQSCLNDLTQVLESRESSRQSSC